MTARLPNANLQIHQLAIPFRTGFKHSASERFFSQPILVEIELANHVVGFGETHPREYVSGEWIDSVIESTREIFVPLLVDFHPTNFGEVIEFAAAPPCTAADGRPITAARCAVELALLDAYSRAMDKSLASIAGYLSDQWLGLPGSHGNVRFSGVVSADDPAKIRRSIFKMRMFGLRDFKLKVGDNEDDQRLETTVAALGRKLNNGGLRLRLDANGAWSLPVAKAKLSEWEKYPISVIEQPLPKSQTLESADLARSTNLPIMADESLITQQDAEDLISQRAASWFNIRLSKNGGLIPAMRLALMAKRHNISYQLGCMVGETSVLSAAGRWFLSLVPNVQFAEGSYGKFLLTQDTTSKSIRFGFRGSWKPTTCRGLGVEVRSDKLKSLAQQSAIRIAL